MDQPQSSPSRLERLWSELLRRRVIRVAVVYAVVGWVMIEVAATVLPPLGAPPWSVTLVVALIALGFPIAIAMGWIFDIGPHGVERTPPLVDDAVEASFPMATQPREDGAGAGANRVENAGTTVAVLPFINLSGDIDNEYFSDGISEEILNLLTKLPQLKVASRTSSFFFKGKEIDIPTVAAKLRVGTILEGSVRRAGNRVRISAELIDAESDSHLWSEIYDRELEDVFAIQENIARSIVDALRVTLSPKERRAIQYVATANVRAYDDYLRGRQHFYAWTRRDSLQAIELYKRAIESDPKYAAAWAGLADAYSMRYRFLEADAVYVDKALEASHRALELDPDSAEAHASRGLALYISKRNEDAERHFETAILISANAFEPYFLYGSCCSARRNFEKAARLFTRASEISPADYLPLVYLAQAYSEMGRAGDERQVRQRITALIQRALELNPHDSRARYMGAANLATLGDRDKALEWADLALQSAADEPMVHYNAACTFAVLGEHRRAIELLEHAVDLGWGDRAWMENDSDLASLRANPRFQALLDRLH